MSAVILFILLTFRLPPHLASRGPCSSRAVVCDAASVVSENVFVLWCSGTFQGLLRSPAAELELALFHLSRSRHTETGVSAPAVVIASRPRAALQGP